APLRRRPLQHDALRLHGQELLAAVRILPVDQAVAVVVDAVAADLDRRAAVRNRLVDAAPHAATGVDRAGIPVVTQPLAVDVPVAVVVGVFAGPAPQVV